MSFRDFDPAQLAIGSFSESRTVDKLKIQCGDMSQIRSGLQFISAFHTFESVHNAS